MNEKMRCRQALLAALVNQAPDQRLGRTALMKLLFLLTTVRDVLVGYRFRMYTYGPFDSEVLSDVDYAARLEALAVEIERYPNGYGYVIRPGRAADRIMSIGREFLDKHRDDIDWVIRYFAPRKAVDLELLSTIVYVDREHGMRSIEEVARVVNEIKPRFAVSEIEEEAKRLQEADVWMCSAKQPSR